VLTILFSTFGCTWAVSSIPKNGQPGQSSWRVFGAGAKKEERSDFACSAAFEISRGTRKAEAWRAKALAASAERYIGGGSQGVTRQRR
jgi:hypothetical protein